MRHRCGRRLSTVIGQSNGNREKMTLYPGFYFDFVIPWASGTQFSKINGTWFIGCCFCFFLLHSKFYSPFRPGLTNFTIWQWEEKKNIFSRRIRSSICVNMGVFSNITFLNLCYRPSDLFLNQSSLVGFDTVGVHPRCQTLTSSSLRPTPVLFSANLFRLCPVKSHRRTKKLIS